MLWLKFYEQYIYLSLSIVFLTELFAKKMFIDVSELVNANYYQRALCFLRMPNAGNLCHYLLFSC